MVHGDVTKINMKLLLFRHALFFGIIAIYFGGIAVSPAHAARLWSSGCELQGAAPGNMVEGLEFSVASSSPGTAIVSTSINRTGLSSCGSIQTAVGSSSISHQYRTLPTYDIAFFRFHMYIDQLPAHSASIAAIGWTNQTLILNPDGTLSLLDRDGTTILGTYATPLATGQWYRIEWKLDSRTPLPSDAEVRVNGQTVIQTANSQALTHGQVALGLCFTNISSICNGGTVTTGSIYFDDIALNDGSGTAQNSWPGAGYIVHLQPDGESSSGSGPGNDCSTSGDWSSVDEITPDDNSTRCVLSGGAKVLRVELESPTSANIDSNATISVVQVGLREAAASASSESWKLFLRPDSGASNTYGSTITHDDVVYKTNGDNTPRNYQLTSYTNPSLSVPWTRSNLNSLIVGLETVDGSPAVHLSTLWALVEYRVPVVVTLDAVPTSVDQGEPSTLTWSAPSAWFCTMGGFGGSFPNLGSEDVVPSMSTIYTMSCEGPGGTGSDIAAVTVVPPGSSASFLEPIGGPYGERTNAGKYLNTGGLFQEKGAGLSGPTGPGLGMDFLTAVKTLCLGPSNCIADWWPTLTRPTTCKLEVHRVRGGSTSFGSVLKTSGCDARLSIPALQAGWVSTGVDYCDDGLCNSSTIAGCVYTRMVCTGGVTVTTPPVSTILTHPFANFTFTPACNDGMDNDGSDGADFPNDPQCSTFADNDESS